MDLSYNFRGKDPIIDVLRTLIQARADIEGMKFKKVLSAIERETNGMVKYGTLIGWFFKKTKWPQHRTVVRVANCLRSYCRRPIQLGDRKAYVQPRSVRKAA